MNHEDQECSRPAHLPDVQSIRFAQESAPAPTRLSGIDAMEEFRPRDVLGQDNRQPSPNLRQPPWRLICHLVMTDAQGREFAGTGWLAGPSTVLTAAHNLYSSAHGYAAASVTVIPGRDGNTAPWGSLTSTSFATLDLWRQTSRAEVDIGVIWLPQALGQSLGYFGFQALDDAVLLHHAVYTAGYPEDRPWGTQWYDQSTIHRVDANLIAYGLDTIPGQSGSPVFALDAAGNPVAVGVHAYGKLRENLGVRITRPMFQILTGWWR